MYKAYYQIMKHFSAFVFKVNFPWRRFLVYMYKVLYQTLWTIYLDLDVLLSLWIQFCDFKILRSIRDILRYIVYTKSIIICDCQK